MRGMKKKGNIEEDVDFYCEDKYFRHFFMWTECFARVSGNSDSDSNKLVSRKYWWEVWRKKEQTRTHGFLFVKMSIVGILMYMEDKCLGTKRQSVKAKSYSPLGSIWKLRKSEG